MLFYAAALQTLNYDWDTLILCGVEFTTLREPSSCEPVKISGPS